MTPHDAFQQEVCGNIESCELDNLLGRISANMILPYPPGVSLIMPGEMLTQESLPVLNFLQMLCEIGQHYPGFDIDIHGIERDNASGKYKAIVLKELNLNYL